MISTNFSWAEAACHDGTEVPEIYKPNALAIVQRVQRLRTLVGFPFKVHSFYRTKEYNHKVRGEKKSYHLTASAMDISCGAPEYPPKVLANLYEGLITLGIVPDGGIGRYDTFIHLDIGPARRWNG